MAKRAIRPGVPVDPEKWSESSKRSVIYDFPPKEYGDINYKCWRCEASAVFTAEEQKQAFERRKAYIWQRRYLCGTCFSERQALERNIRRHSAKWEAQKRQLQRDIAFLKEWLQLLEAHPRYGGKRNEANINMLRRLLEASA